MNTSSIQKNVEEVKGEDGDIEMADNLNSSNMRKSFCISPSKSQIEKTKGEGGVIADTFYGLLNSVISFKDS